MKVFVFFLIINIPHFCFANASKQDSLDVEIVNNIVYILHKVQPGQTLYSLVNKYNCSVAEAASLNPSLKSDVAIKIGETLKFPLIKNGKHVSAWAYNNSLKKASSNKATPPNTHAKAKMSTVGKDGYHVIGSGETIFSISKLYDLDIAYLVEANNILDNKIKVGSKLLVDKNELEKAMAVLEKKKAPALIMEPVGIKIQESGIAEVINTSNRTNKFLALHRSAKVGSTIKVTNEATGISIIAKVVGNLSEKGPDENIMVKLSPFAFYELRPRDSKLRASVEYYLPNARKNTNIK